MYEGVTTERLKFFGEFLREYEAVLTRKKQIVEALGGLKSVDLTKTRVQNGDSNRTSEEERYTMRLEEVNKLIKEYEAWLLPEREIIRTQIERVPRFEYRKILKMRYIQRMKWSEIVKDLFEFQKDYEEGKYGKYKDTVMYWNRRALEELEKVSSKPYIPVQKHLI